MLNQTPNLVKKVEVDAGSTNYFNRLAAYKAMYAEISWAQLIAKLIKALKTPLVSAKYELLMRFRFHWGNRPLPWFKWSLVAVFVYVVFFKKETELNVGLGNPNNRIANDKNGRNNSELSMKGLAQAANLVSKEPMEEIFIPTTPDDFVIHSYIERFTKVALIEMQKYKIPASIKMAQAIIASDAGKSKLAVQYNNHFGIVCQKSNDDCKTISSGNQKVTVKNYESAWENWRDHSKALTQPPYISLQQYGNNYKKWAIGLEELGYEDNKDYGSQLIQLIEKYKLYKLDELNENL